MGNSASVRTNGFMRLAILAASALTMLWLLWRFPRAAGLAAVGVLGALALCARLTKFRECDGEFEPHETGLHTR